MAALGRPPQQAVQQQRSQRQQQQRQHHRQHRPPGSTPSGTLERHHLEVGIIVASGVRLCAGLALSGVAGAAWMAAMLALLHVAALWMEFGPRRAVGSPYCLRRCESQGLAQGVLAVPSVTAALVVAAPQSGAYPLWLEVSCAAAAALLLTVHLQSRVLAATAAGCQPADTKQQQQQHRRSSGLLQACAVPGVSLGMLALWLASARHGGVAGPAALLKQLWGQRLPPSLQQQQLLLRAGALAGAATADGARVPAAVKLGAALAPGLYCLVMQLLPGCFSVGEGALLAEGAVALAVMVAGALPVASAFVPPAACRLLPTPAVAALARLGGCSAAVHVWAVGPDALPAAVALVLGSSLLACLLLRGLLAALRAGGGAPRATALSAARGALAAAAAGGILALGLWLACAAAWTLLEFLPARPGRPAVLAYWAGLLAATLPALRLWASRSGVPQIIVRKVYHLLALGLFVPVFFWDLPLLCLSLAIAFAALVLLEVLRCMRAPGVGAAVQQFMQEFVDERDSGVIYVTHFTLLLGLALPAWLCLGLPGAAALAAAADAPGADARAAALPLVAAGLSGMVVIGVGDTAASMVGKLLGRTPVHAGSRKTLEGTAAGVASSLGTWCLLLAGGGVAGGGPAWWAQLLAATVGAGLMEACTSQLDNILLPLWYLPHLLLVPR